MAGRTAADFSWFSLFSIDSPEQFCPWQGRTAAKRAGGANRSERHAGE